MPLLVWQVDALQSYNVISCCIVQYGGIYGVGQGRLVLSDKNSRNYVVYQGTLSGVPGVSTFLTVAGLAWKPNIWCLLIKVEALCLSGPEGR